MAEEEKPMKHSNFDTNDIECLLQSLILGNPGVLGAAAIDFGGEVLAVYPSRASVSEPVALYCARAYESAQKLVTQMQHDSLDAMISVTSQGYVLTWSFGGGLLVALGERTGNEYFGLMSIDREF